MAAIEIDGLSKRFGSVRAVSGLSFEVAAGRVTGFLGPNGAGKSTTLRMLLGLVHSDGGTATFGGRRYGEVGHPGGGVRLCPGPMRRGEEHDPADAARARPLGRGDRDLRRSALRRVGASERR